MKPERIAIWLGKAITYGMIFIPAAILFAAISDALGFNTMTAMLIGYIALNLIDDAATFVTEFVFGK